MLVCGNGGSCSDAQQVWGYGQSGDVFLGISTSGNPKNACLAAWAAKAKDMTVLGLTGQGCGKLSEIADCCIRVPEREIYLVQELHPPVYHALCAQLEEEFFGEKEETVLL